MNGANNLFTANPPLFVAGQVVNNMRWLQTVGGPTGPQESRLRVAMADMVKAAHIDLQRNGEVGGRHVYDLTLSGSVVQGDAAISAYWCPFTQGTGLPGFVDVPRINPVHRFIFTPAMNGCAFVVANSPLGGGYFRLYHHQHPENQTVNNLRVLHNRQHHDSM
jgi:hypothetical protein